ncbi:MAG: hypothetical protein IKE01_06850 [Clostridia bacterium]|nr:hypothetical protein [Clostridia bacterium]
MKFIRACFVITLICIFWTSTCSILNASYYRKFDVFEEYMEDNRRKHRIVKNSYKCGNTQYLYDISVIEKNLLLKLILGSIINVGV